MTVKPVQIDELLVSRCREPTSWVENIPILKSQSSKGGLQQKIKQHKVVDFEQKEQAYKPFKSQ